METIIPYEELIRRFNENQEKIAEEVKRKYGDSLLLVDLRAIGPKDREGNIDTIKKWVKQIGFCVAEVMVRLKDGNSKELPKIYFEEAQDGDVGLKLVDSKVGDLKRQLGLSGEHALLNLDSPIWVGDFRIRGGKRFVQITLDESKVTIIYTLSEFI
jgi:hypothetical protein